MGCIHSAPDDALNPLSTGNVQVELVSYDDDDDTVSEEEYYNILANAYLFGII